MSRFLTKLDMEAMWNNATPPMPLFTPDGRRLFSLTKDLGYLSNLVKSPIIAQAGFITDLGSVPRIPLVFDVLGEIALEPYVIHDLLYSKKLVSRDVADKILLEALEVVGIPWAKRKLIYAGVRVGGGSHYGS